jgi:hypothetical protein
MLAVRQAAARGNKYVFLNTGRRQYIAKVIGGKRRPRVKMVQDLSKKIIRLQPKPWFGPAVDAAQRRLPEFYKEAFLYQLRRHGVIR